MADEPAAVVDAGAAAAQERSEILAELRAKPADDEPEKKPEPDDAADPEKPDEEATPDDEDAAPDETDEEEKPDEDAEDEEEKPSDPDTAKRLETVRRAERRSKEKLDRDVIAARAELVAERDKIEREWKPRIEAAQEFERLRAKVRTHPWEVLAALGLTEDDAEYAGQVIYAQSKAAGAKPENRVAATRAARERELLLELERTKQRQDDLEKKLTQRDREAANRAVYERFMTSVEKAVPTAKAPLSARALAKNPDRARVRFAEIADGMIAKTGEAPAPAAVLAAFEKARRAELEDDGVDVDALLKTKTPAAKAAAIEVVDKTKAPAAKVDPSAPAKPNGKGRVVEPLPEDPKAEKEQILRELREMRTPDSD